MSSQFDRHCFLKNVREESTSCGLSAVRDKLFSTLLELHLDAPYVETPILRRRLACEKSFIVLDDVATVDQAKNLNIVNNYLGQGSRVIITTRYMKICAQFDECEIYEVEGLKEAEPLELFCWNAFSEKHPKEGYEELTKIATDYCGGNPLAIKVLGANFRKKRKEVWESELEKLKNISNRGIYDVLKLSFDDLDRTEQDIFLDHACFFSFISFSERDYLTILFNACNFFAVSGLEVLLDKALISFSYDEINEIKMHDLLVEMGREIVKKESPKDSGRRSRLWDPEEVCDVLKYNKGTEFVEVIYFDISEIGDVYLSSDSFKSMINLRFLHIIDSLNHTREKIYNVHFLEGLEWLSDKLRHLHWESFPLQSLPSTFCAKRLVQLRMSNSKLKKLWDGIQKLDNLMIIQLDHSKDLIEIPNLSMAPNLEVVSLSNCESLCKLHPSIFTAPKLRKLYLDGCIKIESLKTNIHSKSFERLDLRNCSSLVEFSVTSEEMAWLFLCGTAIHEFPSSLWHNSKLTRLYLNECKKLNIVGKKLSNDPGLGSLTCLNLSGCTQISTSNLCFILDGMQSLEQLYLNECCNLEALPDNIQNNSMLQILYLDECKKLKSLPKLPSSLQQLIIVNCIYLDTNSIQRPMLENMLHRLQINYNNESNNVDDMCLFPGAQVSYEFEYHTTEASIVIPPIPKYGLSGFVFCIILSEGLYSKDYIGSIYCTMYENKKVVHQCFVGGVGLCGTLISDHVLLLSLSNYTYKLVEWGSESGQDHYSLSFEFKFCVGAEQWTTKGINGCGVIPVYGLEYSLLDGRSSVQIVELQSSDQVSDESDQQHSELNINDLRHRSSTDENEDDKQQQLIPDKEKEDDLNDKSSCACSIGHLFKHFLEESKRYFS